MKCTIFMKNHIFKLNVFILEVGTCFLFVGTPHPPTPSNSEWIEPKKKKFYNTSAKKYSVAILAQAVLAQAILVLTTVFPCGAWLDGLLKQK